MCLQGGVCCWCTSSLLVFRCPPPVSGWRLRRGAAPAPAPPAPNPALTRPHLLQSYDEKTEIVLPADGHLDDEEALHNQLIKRHLEASIAAAAALGQQSAAARGRGRGRGGGGGRSVG